MFVAVDICFQYYLYISLREPAVTSRHSSSILFSHPPWSRASRQPGLSGNAQIRA